MSSRTLDRVCRLRDILFALFVLVLTAPLQLLALVIVRLKMGSPVLFRHKRLGLGGTPFEMLKIRTMQAPQVGRESSAYDAERLTRLGRLLRMTSIDELPSFINLLRGDVTLVGPRPLPVHYWSRFVDEEYKRFEVRPGITGLAQVEGRNTIDWSDRLALDVEYVETRSLVGDVRILLQTVPVVLTAQGVNERPGATMAELPPDRRLTDRRSGVDRRVSSRDTPDRRQTVRRALDDAAADNAIDDATAADTERAA